MKGRFLKVVCHGIVAIVLVVIASCISCIPNSKIDDLSHNQVKNMTKSAVFVEFDRIVDVSKLNIPGTVVANAGGSGSGTVVAVKGNKSLILTAGHVCHDEKEITIKDPSDETKTVDLPVIIIDFTVTNSDGEKFEHATIVKKDDLNDLCVLEVTGITGPVMKLASKLPEVGSKIYYAGAPAGIWFPPAVPIFVGIYDGLAKDDSPYGKFMFSMPVIGGASGSGVVYGGRLVGVVVQGYTKFPLIGYATPLNAIKDILKAAQENWSV